MSPDNDVEDADYEEAEPVTLAWVATVVGIVLIAIATLGVPLLFEPHTDRPAGWVVTSMVGHLDGGGGANDQREFPGRPGSHGR